MVVLLYLSTALCLAHLLSFQIRSHSNAMKGFSAEDLQFEFVSQIELGAVKKLNVKVNKETKNIEMKKRHDLIKHGTTFRDTIRHGRRNAMHDMTRHDARRCDARHNMTRRNTTRYHMT